ncbi:hypothetical protein DU56_10335 [Methanosarcina mazei]|uniref:Uncharacterized protein n=1 Tax=Methanosarcina mazei TaxID=2209 RepID=A0A0F8M763_METMZ|nr:hypothetical protein DU33_04940 [Methanosarcina mazei]KKG60127.1 hypothetical protein DU45_13490 [Methanosarcina mazei]KKH01386.1 hypothetical protein DU56_10335 [Methanosarcina mazei]
MNDRRLHLKSFYTCVTLQFLSYTHRTSLETACVQTIGMKASAAPEGLDSEIYCLFSSFAA